MIVVIGEALLDVIQADREPPLARPGESLYNAAVGLARLGRAVPFVGRFSTDPFGAILRSHAARSGVDLSLAPDVHAPSSIALIQLDDAGTAHYRFHVDSTAGFGWVTAQLARIPDNTSAAHFGSLASWLVSSDAMVRECVAALRAGVVLVTYNPNARPQQADAAAARASVEGAVNRAPWTEVLDRATLVAALTCARPRADPSRRHELATVNLSIQDTHIPAEPIRFRAGNRTGSWR